jgi:uncharacterized protein (TIGR00255 family)
MTGFGEAHCQRDGLAVAVEVRSINSRYFKLAIRSAEGYGALEPLIEGLVRKCVRRGTIQVNVRIERSHLPEDFKINTEVVRRYRSQIEGLQQQWNLHETVPLTTLLLLPGVVDEGGCAIHDVTADWPAVEQTLGAALENLAQMRAEEGRAMAVSLRANCAAVAAALEQIARRVPLVVEAYRTKIEERLKRTLAGFDATVDPADVVKEVGMMAEKADTSEEVVRLQSHLDQFAATIELPESAGRKLEFLTQEMFREANTIGSKAGDLEIARHVIEIKSAIERNREMIQNVE